MSENKIMKDKEIIIDGVDVSGCEYFSRYGNGCQLMQPLGFCKPQDNCLYKQLKRMEQKNADLNDEVEALKVAKNFASINLTNYIADNDKLKAENEQLKRENEIITGMHNSSSNRFDKLYNTLQEIKEIAGFHITDEDCEDVQNDMEQIIDLITKAESEEV